MAMSLSMKLLPRRKPPPGAPLRMKIADDKRDEFWPALPFSEWKDTAATLHMWMQIVGKIRLTLSPWINHSWHVTLYVTPRGLTTSPIPYGLCTFRSRSILLIANCASRKATAHGEQS